VPLPAAMLTAMVPVTGIEAGVLVRELTGIHTQWAAGGEETLREAGLATKTSSSPAAPRRSRPGLRRVDSES